MTGTVPTDPVLERTRGFRWGQVPSEGRRGLAPQPEPDLGAIASFTGTFRGAGFNAIFRPQDFAVTPTPLPNPAHGPDDNILELNLTEETEVFSTDWSFGGGQDECRFGDGADSLRAQSVAVERLPAGLEQRDPAFPMSAQTAEEQVAG